MVGTATPPPAVVGRGVVLARGDRVALATSDFQFPKGAVTAVIGPNGSGKSTLLHGVAGLLRPRSGSISVLGHDAAEQRTRVRYVPQFVRVNERLPVTVREVVTMARYATRGAWGRLRREDRAAVADAIDRLDIADLAGRHMRELSGGQGQRVAVAQGLAQEGEVLLLDEPMTGLDLPSAARTRAVVDEERRAGRCVVVSTHDLAEAGRADHVVLLAGRVVASGRPDEVLTVDVLTTTFGGSVLRTDGGAVVVELPAHGHAHH